MSAKLLYSLTSDENNPNMQKQMGCINGIFHLFDRQHLSNRNQKLLPSGQINNNERLSRQASKKNKEEKNSKASRKAQKSSPETPRPSTSSSRSSSTLSSVECSSSKMTQPETTSFNQNIYSQKPSNEHRLNQGNSKNDSNYFLPSPIKTATKHNVVNHPARHVDSPRSPAKQCGVVNHRSRIPSLNKSSPTDSRKNASAHPVVADKGQAPKMEIPRWSYDGGRELLSHKTSLKLKELPRLSLDSREKTLKQSTAMPKPDAFSIQDRTSSRSLDSQQEPGSYRPLSNVVAKLMGLDDLPDTASTAESPVRPKTSSSVENIDRLSRSSRSIDSSKLTRVSDSPRSRHRRNLSIPNSDNTNLDVKPKLGSTPAEAEGTLRKQWTEGHHPDSKKTASQHQEEAAYIESQNLSASLYGEIEKRLADLDFKKSGKDLRALKQILEAMQRIKSNPCAGKENQEAESASQTSDHGFGQDTISAIRQNVHNDHCMRAINLKKVESTITTRHAYGRKSPTRQPEAVIKDKNPSNLCQPRINRSINRRWETAKKTETTEPNPRSNIFQELPCRTLSTLDRYPAARPARTSKTPDQMTKEKSSIWGDRSQNLGPKLQNKNVRLANPDCVSSLSSYLNRQQNQQPRGRGSPGQKTRPKSPSLQQNSQPQNSTSSDQCISFSQQSNATSHDGSNTSQVPQIADDVARSSQVIVDSISEEIAKEKGLVNSSEGLPINLRIATREQSSPVSVLDAFYEDESPSPVKKRSTAFRDNETSIGTEEKWKETDNNDSLPSSRPNLDSENYKKPDNFHESIQKLWKPSPTQQTLASVREHASSGEKYIFEILFASGLLGDLDCTAVVSHIHQTGQAIHPGLFSLLEKALSTLSDQECCSEEHAMLRSNNRHQRRLIFDAVNEILLQRFSFTGFCSQPRLLNKFTGYGNTGKQFPSELWKEMDQLQINSFHDLDNEDDFLTNIISKDLTLGSEIWTDFSTETPGLVLDIERLIYKDLLVELLSDGAGVSQALERGCRRHLFSQ